MKTIKLSGLALSAILLVTSCKKDNENDRNTGNIDNNKNLIILNEGGWGANNASVSFYNGSNETLENNKFYNVNNRNLGDVANDIAEFNDNIYVILNGSNTIEVFNSSSFISVATIDMTDKSPRNITFNNDHAFVSNFDGTVSVIDVNSFSVIKNIQVGANPEQLAILGNKLYVANSGGLQLVLDSTLSVIDLSTLEEVEKIVVGKNLKKVFVKNNTVYTISEDVYNDDYSAILVPKTLYSYNVNTMLVDTLEANCEDFSIVDNVGYLYDGTNINVFNFSNNTLGNSVYAVSNIDAFYSFGGSGSGFYISDAKDYANEGVVSFYDNSWTSNTSFDTGVIPSKVIIVD